MLLASWLRRPPPLSILPTGPGPTASPQASEGSADYSRRHSPWYEHVDEDNSPSCHTLHPTYRPKEGGIAPWSTEHQRQRSRWRTALMYASGMSLNTGGNVEVVELLLQTPNIDAEVKSLHRETASSLASWNEESGVEKLVHEYIDRPFLDQYRPFGWVSSRKNLEQLLSLS
ncbi:hypothetical protein BKA70DRAFT_1286482 [Coprinopsis sp. MPI-PUGE-AT-0042]|nr:hypothetical protein BKA70DRAFT_1286482 [Coprinopsis sp. MPI-PUGE-AT-0042]